MNYDSMQIQCKSLRLNLKTVRFFVIKALLYSPTISYQHTTVIPAVEALYVCVSNDSPLVLEEWEGDN